MVCKPLAVFTLSRHASYFWALSAARLVLTTFFCVRVSCVCVCVCAEQAKTKAKRKKQERKDDKAKKFKF